MHLQGYDLVPCVKWFPCLHQPSNPSHWLHMEDKRDSVREGWSHGCEGSLASERQTNHALGFFFLFSEGMWEDSLGVSWGKMGLDWYLYYILASKKKRDHKRLDCDFRTTPLHMPMNSCNSDGALILLWGHVRAEISQSNSCSWWKNRKNLIWEYLIGFIRRIYLPNFAHSVRRVV